MRGQRGFGFAQNALGIDKTDTRGFRQRTGGECEQQDARHDSVFHVDSFSLR